MDKIQISLYEITGYLLPGSLAMLAIAIFYWAVWLPTTPVPVYKVSFDVIAWLVTGISAYLLGHCVQSIGNQLITHVEKAALSKSAAVPESIVQRAKQRIGTLIGVKPEELDPMTLFRLADEISVQNGAVTDRDIFVAREGLCKGCAIALVLLCLALLMRALFGTASIKFPGYVYYISWGQLLLAAAGAAFAAYLFRRRARRFGTYRVSRAIYAVLASESKRKE